MGNLIEKSELRDSNYNWFTSKLSEDFKIENTNKSKVIFGFNGIGKTTLYKVLKNKLSNTSFFVDYTETLDIFKAKKKKLSFLLVLIK